MGSKMSSHFTKIWTLVLEQLQGFRRVIEIKMRIFALFLRPLHVISFE